MSERLRGLARAKINLGLAVLGRRPDGYHDLASVFVRLALADALSVAFAGGPPTTDPAADLLEVVGRRPTEDPGQDLVLRAAALLRTEAGRPLPPLAFRLVKRIPVAAGLGGGSADAAAALALAGRAWGLVLGRAQRLELAARLGSDVPFFAAGLPAAWVEGRGERIESVPPPGDLGVLLVSPKAGLDTAAVFAAFDRLAAAEARSQPPRDAVPERAGRASGEAGAWSSTVGDLAAAMRDGNDLWPAAADLCPGLVELRERLERSLERPVLLSGSGPTLVALYPSGTAAAAAVRRVDAPDANVIATQAA